MAVMKLKASDETIPDHMSMLLHDQHCIAHVVYMAVCLLTRLLNKKLSWCWQIYTIYLEVSLLSQGHQT